MGKVRTITVGVCLSKDETQWRHLLKQSIFYASALRKVLESSGIEVQTLRVCTNPFEQYCGGPHKMLASAASLESICKLEGIQFLSIGCLRVKENILLIPQLIAETTVLSCSACLEDAMDEEMAMELANVVVRIGRNGCLGNFRFAVAVNHIKPTPFFPCAFSRGQGICLSIGLENTRELNKAFEASDGSLRDAKEKLQDEFNALYTGIDFTVENFCNENRIRFEGFDCSICPSLSEEESIVNAFQCIRWNGHPLRFGLAGTLSVVSMITLVLKSIPVPQCGYSGLMLPLCEDTGLARAALSISDLLQYSSVCGVGIDTVPVPGDVSPSQLAKLILDVATMAYRVSIYYFVSVSVG